MRRKPQMPPSHRDALLFLAVIATALLAFAVAMTLRGQEMGI